MRIVKFKQKNTYKGKDGKEHHYYGYSLVLDNGKQVRITCLDADDYRVLDAVCEYVKTSK